MSPKSPFCLIPQAFLVLSLACGGQGSSAKPGGPCTYQEVQGTAACEDIERTAQGVRIRMVFTPTDPSARSTYRLGLDDTFLLTWIRVGDTSDSAFLAATGVTVGATYPCIRMEILTGTCTPVIYRLPTAPWADGL